MTPVQGLQAGTFDILPMYWSIGASYPDQLSQTTYGRNLYFDPAPCPTFGQNYVPWVQSGTRGGVVHYSLSR